MENPQFNLRHLALQIATQLPHDPTEAHTVLDFTLQLVDGFLSADEEMAEVVPLQPKPRPDSA
jgi:hypothetical protein